MKKLIPFIFLVFALILSSCHFKSWKSEEFKVEFSGKKQIFSIKNTIRLNFHSEPPQIDWQKASDSISAHLVNNIMQGLTSYQNVKDEKNLVISKIVPGLAESWEPNANATKWIFHLKKNVKWTDGVEFTADQFVSSFERLMTADTASEFASFLFFIQNAQDFNQKKIKDFSKVGVHARDPWTLEFSLNQPVSYLPSILAHYSTFPVRTDLIKKYGDHWVDVDKIQTLGAYKLQAWQHDKALWLRRNDSYFGEQPQIENIVAYMINEASTAANLYDTDQLDINDLISSTDIPKLKNHKEFRTGINFTIQYYGFNTKNEFLKDPLVRKAINLAIDRKQLVKLMGAGQKPMNSFLPYGIFAYNEDIGLKFDPALAQKLLLQAGYKTSKIEQSMNGFDISSKKLAPRIQIQFNTGEDNQKVAENIQAQIFKNLGLEIELKSEEWKTYLKHVKTQTPDIYRSGWSADFADPESFIGVLKSNSENNNTKWKSEQYDKLAVQAASELNEKKRLELYNQIQKLLCEEDVPVIPLFSSVKAFMIKKRVQNYLSGPMSSLIMKDTRLEQQ